MIFTETGISILTQTVYKEAMENVRTGLIPHKNKEKFWDGVKEETLELARTICRVEQTILDGQNKST